MAKPIIVSLIIVLLLTAVGKSTSLGNWDQVFDQQIESWIKQLSDIDLLYSEWHKANWQSQSYAPGSRQWLIVVQKNVESIGYLVVGENEVGELILLEYGIGEYLTKETVGAYQLFLLHLLLKRNSIL